MNSNRLRTSVGALAFAMVCAASAQTVSGVATHKVGGGLQVQIKGEDLGKPKASWTASKRTYTLVFEGKLDGKSKSLKVGSNGLTSLSYGWFARKPAKVRVSFHVAKGAAPKLVENDGSWAVNFNVAEEEAAPKMPVSNAFPDKVPPIRYATKATDLMAVTSGDGFSAGGRVSLDFVNTDIVQILKALALQANVNIVTSPEVAGKITVTLDQVSVKEALDMVTALGNVRYTKMGSTYIVTSNSRFSDTIQQIQGGIDASSETRVVPLFSGEGTQIKAAILKTVSPSTVSGKYDLVLPSDKLTINSTQAVTPTGGKGDDKGASQGTQAEVQASSDSNGTGPKRDDYIVVVGTASRLNEVEKAIRSVDLQICHAMGIKVSEETGMIQRTYEPNGIYAEDLLKAIRADKTVDFGSVKLIATPKQSMSRQVIVLSGRAPEVDNMLTMLKNLDSLPQGGPSEFAVLGIQHVKPQVVMAQLMDAIPGLRASLLPAPVDPMVGIAYQTGWQTTSTSNQGTNGAQNSGTQGSGGDQSQSSSTSTTAGGSSPVGTVLTKDNIAAALATGGAESGGTGTSNSVPMKVMVRGTHDQIEEARKLLAVMDMPPKQVAVEVRVMELSKDEALKAGLDWGILTGGSLTSLHINQGLGTDATAGGISSDLGFKGGGTASIVGVLDSISTKSNLLARPNMLATDGVPSDVFVGDTIRYIKSLQSTQSGVTVVTDEINVGVDFALLARIGDGGNISLELNPVLSVLQGFTDVTGGGQLPQTSVRSARMQVNIKSGETIAIGGLIQDQDRKSYGGIPILKDLPIIGRLFGRTDNHKVRSEVVFFVTVKEVTEANRQAAANPNESERTNKEWPGNKDGKKGN